MKVVLGLVALLVIGFGELGVSRRAIAQTVPIQTAEAAALSGTTERAVIGSETFTSKPEPIQPSATVQPEISEALKLELRLSERQLLVYRGEMLIANYAVAVGREGWQTPTGEFSVFQKQSDPTWEHPFTGELVPPGPDNPLGSRWIGFWSDGQNSIGFHGTPDESVMGSAVSHGCVRMRNEDVQALYELVNMDTVVVVLP
ncbi:MAG: L,D-transpeptidase [Cyanobacteria bacterium J06650_10]